MRKFSLLAGVSALALAVAACGDDAPENVTTAENVVVENSELPANDMNAVEENTTEADINSVGP